MTCWLAMAILSFTVICERTRCTRVLGVSLYLSFGGAGSPRALRRRAARRTTTQLATMSPSTRKKTTDGRRSATATTLHDSPMKSTHNKIAHSTRLAALRFDEADGDDSRALDFEEFVAMQPTKVRESHSEAT